jgi:hypothetical protein
VPFCKWMHIKYAYTCRLAVVGRVGREFREILKKIWAISGTKKFREIWVTNMRFTGVMPLPAAGEENLQPGCLEPGSSCFFREITAGIGL